jgi:leucyl-tRNA synthetase
MRLSNVLSDIVFNATGKTEKNSSDSLTSNQTRDGEMRDKDPHSSLNRAVLNSDTFLFGLKTLLLLLTPMAPHFGCEVWHYLVNTGQEINIKSSAIAQPWPTYDPNALQSDSINLIIQV